MSARPAVLHVLPFAGCRTSTCSWRCGQLLVIVFGSITTPQPVLARQRRITWQRQPLRVEIVVDLAVAGGVPASVIHDACGLLAPLVVPQEVPHFMNEQRRVLLDGVRCQPGVVVVQAPM